MKCFKADMIIDNFKLSGEEEGDLINPRYAIVTPCFNSEKYLRQAVESVLAQTYANFELFLIDDGSTDSTPEICNYYSEVDARIHIFFTKVMPEFLLLGILHWS